MEIKYSINRFFKRVPRNKNEKNRFLIIAANHGHTKMVATLIDGGADVDKISGLSYTDNDPLNSYFNRPLYMAARNGHTETVEVLLEKGANANEWNGMTSDRALLIATSKGHTNTVTALTKGGADTELTDNGDRTALHIAASQNDYETVVALLDGGADIDKITTKFPENGIGDVRFNDIGRLHETALHIATRSGNPETVDTLLERGARVDIKDRNGKTALDLANDNNKLKSIFEKYRNRIDYSGLTISPDTSKVQPRRKTKKHKVSLEIEKNLRNFQKK